MPDAIVLKHVKKTFGETVAVRDLDLVVPEGALYGVIGPNGAGKTTMIRMILSILFPDHGELTVLGRPSALEAKDRIGYLPEERGLYKKMRVAEFLVYMARLKGVDGTGVERQVARVAGAGGAGRRRAEALRGAVEGHAAEGAVRRGGHPPARPADPRRAVQRPRPGQPAAAARPGARRAPARRDGAVLHAHHDARRAAVRPRGDDPPGDKVLDQTMAGIRDTFDPHRIVFEPLDPGADVQRLRSVPGVADVVARRHGAGRSCSSGRRTPATSSRRWWRSVVPSRVEVSRPTLEDVFVSIVVGRRVERDRRRGAAAGGAARGRAGGAAMKKILYVAAREFLATVTTKGFVFGILITPILIAGMIFLIPKYITKTPAEGRGAGGRRRPDGRGRREAGGLPRAGAVRRAPREDQARHRGGDAGGAARAGEGRARAARRRCSGQIDTALGEVPAAARRADAAGGTDVERRRSR